MRSQTMAEAEAREAEVRAKHATKELAAATKALAAKQKEGSHLDKKLEVQRAPQATCSGSPDACLPCLTGPWRKHPVDYAEARCFRPGSQEEKAAVAECEAKLEKLNYDAPRAQELEVGAGQLTCCLVKLVYTSAAIRSGAWSAYSRPGSCRKSSPGRRRLCRRRAAGWRTCAASWPGWTSGSKTPRAALIAPR